MSQADGPPVGFINALDRTTADVALLSGLAAQLRRPGNQRVWIGGHDRNVRRLVEAAMEGTPRPADGPLDCAVVTPRDADEAEYFAAKAARRLRPTGLIYVFWTEIVGAQAKVGIDVAALRTFLKNLGFDVQEAWTAPPLHGVRAARRVSAAPITTIGEGSH
ncbi:MAG: hypothetical protein FLDDKLPJ_00563 [Phycisphaerae bacterium]|nr:hypothetical protein [Phycisphaerae bacterium]